MEVDVHFLSAGVLHPEIQVFLGLSVHFLKNHFMAIYINKCKNLHDHPSENPRKSNTKHLDVDILQELAQNVTQICVSETIENTAWRYNLDQTSAWGKLEDRICIDLRMPSATFVHFQDHKITEVTINIKGFSVYKLCQVGALI